MSRKEPLPDKLDKKPTDVKGFNPDPESRVSAGIGKDGRMKYVYDGKEVISTQDGFSMLTGRQNVPKSLTSYLSINKERFDKIFGENK